MRHFWTKLWLWAMMQYFATPGTPENQRSSNNNSREQWGFPSRHSRGADKRRAAAAAGSNGKRKRGKRGGVKVRCRKRGLKVSLPTVTFGNVRSVRNKCDELETLVKYQHDYKNSCIIGLTETWLQDIDTGRMMSLTGFTLIRWIEQKRHTKSEVEDFVLI